MVWEVIKIDKLEAAERQLCQAIRLFFGNGDPVSIHTLSQAASQILIDIGKVNGVESEFRTTNVIKEEYRQDWINYFLKDRNYFKHADRDEFEILEFKPEINNYVFMDCILMLNQIKKQWIPETLVYMIWFSRKYPDYLVDDTDWKTLIDSFSEIGDYVSPENLKTYCELINGVQNQKAYAKFL